MWKIIFIFLLTSCGSPQQTAEPTPAPGHAPQPGGGELTFNSDIKPLLNNYCAECHSDGTFMSSQTAFLGSKAPTRIANKSMPQRQGKNSAKFGNAERAIFAEFVQDNK